MDELDEFNEAPHSLRCEVNSVADVGGDSDDNDNHSLTLDTLDNGDVLSTDLLVGENDVVLSTDDLLNIHNNHLLNNHNNVHDNSWLHVNSATIAQNKNSHIA